MATRVQETIQAVIPAKRDNKKVKVESMKQEKQIPKKEKSE